VSDEDRNQRDAQLRDAVFTRLLEEARSSAGDAIAGIEDRARVWFTESERAFQEQLAGVRHDAMEAVRADRAAFNAAVAEIDRQRTQAGVLSAMMDAAAHFAPRVAFFVVRSGTVVGWKARGFQNGLSDETVGQLATPIAGQTLVGEALAAKSAITSGGNTGPDELSFLGEYAHPQAKRVVAVPLVIRDRAAAVLYADSGAGEELDLQPLEALLRVTGMAIELLPIRRRNEHPGAPGLQPPRFQASPLQAVVGAEASGVPEEVPALPREELESPARSNRREHLDAIRYARFLIADIKLYEPAKVADGCRRADLYDRLKDEIERSRTLYQKHVSPLITAQVDYFYAELVNTLAEGDSSKLGRNSPWSSV